MENRKNQIATLFFLQYFCVVETLILLGWHLENYKAISIWFFLPSVWSGSVALCLFIVGVIITEWKMRIT